MHRALSERALEQWRAVSEAAFYADAVNRGAVIRSELVDVEGPVAASPAWAGFLRHDEIPLITYTVGVAVRDVEGRGAPPARSDARGAR